LGDECEVLPGIGQAGDGLRFDGGSGVWILKRKERLLSVDFDRLGSGRYGEIEVERDGAANLNGDGRRGLLGKVRDAHGDGIGSGIDLREEKAAIVVGLHCADGLGVDLCRRNAGTRQGGACGVEHRARDSA